MGICRKISNFANRSMKLKQFDKTMKIIYITDCLSIWGGLERILIDKMNYLADTYDYDVHIITCCQINNPIPYPLSEKVTFHDIDVLIHHQYRYKGLKRLFVRYKLNRLFYTRLKSCISQIKPDVIIGVRFGQLAAILRAKGNIPLVVESHSSCKWYQFEVHKLKDLLREKYFIHLVSKAQHVVALTNGDANDWKEFNPHVSVIPNIVHLNDTGIYSDCNSKSVIFVGRFAKQKDIGALIKVWTIVNKKHPDWKLNIYGGYGDQYDELHSLLENPSLNIYVHEPTLDIFKEYINSSILLLTSLYEPFGLVLPESMSCGLPVVAFDCPFGPADIITDSVDGFLIHDRNIDEFAEKVCLLMSDEQLRKKMGKAGIKSSQRYQGSLIMPKWDNLFKMLKENSSTD